MKKTMINRTHIEGLLYEHKLEMRVTGENSKNPGTEYIRGSISIATNDACDNIVPINFTYVTAVTSKGNPNATFGILKDIVDGNLKSVMEHGKDVAAKLRIDSAIGLNDFYNNDDELVSAKRNDGGFIHTTVSLDEDEKNRNTFEVDMVITNCVRKDADEDRNLPEKLDVRGAIFSFNKSLLPVTFSVLNPRAMDYFENLGASSKEPVFTKLRGRQVSEVTVRKITEESAFGETYTREIPSTRRDWVITWAAKEPYIFDDEEFLTAQELTDAMAARQTYLATVKQRNDEYKASRNNTATASAPKTGGFDF